MLEFSQHVSLWQHIFCGIYRIPYTFIVYPTPFQNLIISNYYLWWLLSCGFLSMCITTKQIDRKFSSS